MPCYAFGFEGGVVGVADGGDRKGSLAVPSFDGLEVPEEDFALLVADDEDRVAALSGEEGEAHVERVCFGSVELKETSEGTVES